MLRTFGFFFLNQIQCCYYFAIRQEDVEEGEEEKKIQLKKKNEMCLV